MIEFTLPLPCSVNELYTVARGRKILSHEARMWRSDTWIKLNQLTAHPLWKDKPKTICGHVSITYDFTFPDNRRRDISNYIKQVEDAIVQGRIIADDSLVIAFSATKTIVKGVREVKVRIEDIKDE